jgi:azobenzene reductase
MHIALIAGSHRPHSQSGRIGTYIAGRLATLQPSTSTDLIDLGGNPLPLWDESAWQKDGAAATAFAPYAARLIKADGLVIISPEWAGMVAPGLKNFLLYTHESQVGHKPALITTVSSGRGGSYPVNELRTSGYKNNKILYIPEHIIVRDAEKIFVEGSSHGDDGYLRGRVDFALKILLAYTDALKPLRTSGIVADKAFPFGM